MKTCTHCGFQNPEDIHICLRCATILQQTCPKCGADVPIQNKFCGNCGAKMNEPGSTNTVAEPELSKIDMQDRLLKNLRSKMPTSLMEKMTQASSDILGQRREVTPLCVEIMTENKADQAISSEDLYLAFDELLHLFTDSIYQYEGIIDQFTGQGIIALFGIPINHENDPERAVRAALEMMQAFQKAQTNYQEKYPFKLEIRIGINTGSVITGNQMSQQHVEYTVVGNTINLANELLKKAKPGQILTSFNTYQRVAPIFEFRVIAEQIDSVGMVDSSCYEPLKVRFYPGQVRGIPGLYAPLVGRLEDLDILQAAFTRVTQFSESQIVLIGGEAGLGKSRLVTEFRNSQGKNGVQCYWGTCAAYMKITPYRVVGDIIRNLLKVSELDSPSLQRDALQDILTNLNLEKHDILPNLLLVLGLLQENPMLEVRLKLLEPVMLQRQTQLALRTFFTTIARKKPTIFVFDDLHWVDQASQQFLEYFCQAITEEPIFIVLVSRDFEKFEPSRLIAEAAEKHVYPPVRIKLEPLSTGDSLTLVNELIRESSSQADRIKETIIQRAAGNPFYTEELVRILIDRGGMVYHESEFQLTQAAGGLLSEVPGTLQDIILARFDRLPEPLRQLAQKASLLGDLFAVRLLKNIYPGSLEELESGLEELKSRDFLVFTQVGNEDIFIFKHPLLQETIYKTMLKRDARNLHYEIGSAIESGEHWLPGERNQILAWHFSESRNPPKAIPYLLTSAEQAFRHFAHGTVSQLYRQALALMNETPGIQPEKVNQVKIGLSQAIKYSGQFTEATQLLQEVIDYHQSQSDQSNPHPLLIESLREMADIRSREGNLEVAVNLLRQGIEYMEILGRDKDPVLWRRLVDRIAWVYFRQGKLEEAYNLADMALIEVKSWETDDPITLASLYNTLGGIYWTRLRYQDAIESVGRSLAIYQNLEYQWGMAIALTNLGVLNFSIGKWEDSIKSLEMADEIRREYGHHPERPINLINLGEALIASGDFQRARIVLENSLEISKRLGSEIYQAYTYLTLGHLNILDKKISDAEACLENGWHLLEPYSEHSEREAQYLRLKALTLLQKEDFTSGHAALRQALEIAEQGGYIAQKVDVLRTMGMINTRMGNHSLAENELLQSIELGNNPFIQAQGLCELGNLYIQKAKSNPQEEWVWWKKAENKLDQAISSFENLGARYDLQRAQSLRSILPSKDPLADTTSPEDNPAVTALRRKLGIADGEWYQATILAISLIPNQQVDEEILFETIAFLVPLLIEFIKDKGGQTLRHPNGVIGIFGAPAAHEDDTERAVDTGMAITNFYAELYQQTQLPISIRIGISMGKIVAGWVNQDTSGEFLAAGHSLQIARNLAEVTSPSRIWVTQAVRNLTSFRFDYSPVPIELVETLEENIFFQLVGERDQVLPVRGLIGLKAVFVGRQPELTMMLNLAEFLFEETATGGMVWIEGEPGIGKSRLTRELETTLEPRGALVCRGSCNARRSDFAFSVFSDLLSDALDIQPNFTQQQITDQVKLKLGQWHKDFDELQPFIEMLVGTQPSGPLGEQLISLEPEQLRRQTFVALNRFFSKLTEQHPLVLILDDVHWIDSISADLLLYLSPLTFKYPVMIICTQRSSEPGTFEQTMARVRSLSAQRLLNINLDPLSTQDCQLLLNHYLSGNKLDETLKTLIIQQSGGNPYFIEEFVRMLMEQDYLRMVQGSLEINQKWQMDHLNIPSSLETLIRARVDSLPISARHLLQVASVLGNRFIESLLAKVTERADTHHLLEVLRDRGMLIQTSEEGIWEFSHQMIEVIVYNTVLKAQRRILHLRAAQALEVQWSGSENEHADELAYHYGKAENYAKTLGYLILAGERAASRYANDASISNFEQASDMLSAVTNVTDTHRWRIINGLGEVYRFMGNYEASLITLQAGLEMLKDSSLSPTQLSSLYRLVGETYLSKGELEQAINYFMKGLEMIGDPNNLNSETEAARIYTRLGRVHFLKSDVEQAQYAAQKAEELAVKTNSLNTLAAAENVLGGIFWSKGDIPLAMAHTRKAMSFWQELGYTWGVAVTYNNLAILEANSGDWNAAAESFQKALALRIEMGDVEGIALAQNNIGNLAKDQGHLEQADAAYRASLTVSEPFQMHYHEAVSYNNLAQNLVLQERFDEAAAAAKKCQELALTLEARELLAEIKRIFAQIALAKNQLQEAEQIAREAIVVAQEINNTRHVSSATRVFTDILLEQGNPQEALRILRECWDQLHQNLDELETGRIHAQLAKLYLAVGDSNMTNENRKEAQRIFEYLGAQHDLAVLNNLS